MADQRIDEARNENIEVALADLDPSVAWVDPPPFVAAHRSRRGKPSFSKTMELLFGRKNLGAHS